MELTQQQAEHLITLTKRFARDAPLIWKEGERYDELVIGSEEEHLRFVLTMTRKPLKIKFHFRTKDMDIGLARVDNFHHHMNPDGTELIDTPHLHLYREGFKDLAWAEPITWYDPQDPFGTLERFLGIIHTEFPYGIQMEEF